MASPEKILMISAEYPPELSGMGDYAFNLVSSLRALPERPRVEVQRGWKLEEVSSKIKEFKPQIVHLQYLSVSYKNDPAVNRLPADLRKAFPKIRFVTTYHEFSAPYRRLALWPLLRNSHAHLTTNDRHLSFFNKFKQFGILRGMTAKVPLASNVPFSRVEADTRRKMRNEMSVEENEFLIVRFGIIHDVILPHLMELTGTFQKARASGLPLKLLLLGKAEARAKDLLTQKIRGEKIEGVIFKNDLPHGAISDYLNASDLGLALYPDGVSEKRTALLALMEHGLPLVATQKGVLPQEFENGRDMLCVPAGAAAELWLEKWKQLIQDEGLRKKLSEEAVKTAALHKWDAIAKQTLKVYEQVLSS